jgi:hypothetical protein
MAITCSSTIEVLDVEKKILRITAEIQNDTEPVHTVVIENVDASGGLDAAKKTEIANTVFNKFVAKRNYQLARAALDAQVASADLANALNNNIQGRSV